MALLFTDPLFQEHQTGQHPESVRRLTAILQRLEHSPVLARYTRAPARAATPEELLRSHTAEHIAHVKDFAAHGGGRIEVDTLVSRKSYDVAVAAAGTAVAAVDAVLKGEHQRAMVLSRPPGHHALRGEPMGFCLFNNVAVAAEHARAAHKLSRILIVDWDVHHGNGTQDAFYEDGGVYFFSAHRAPFYPGTGSVMETGKGKGLGTIFNLPLAFGISRKDYLSAFARTLDDAATKCQPELILISAGFDAHADDPIGSLGLESEDYGALTKLVVQAADQHCQGRIVSLLEGGYNVDAQAESVEIHLDALVPAK